MPVKRKTSTGIICLMLKVIIYVMSVSESKRSNPRLLTGDMELFCIIKNEKQHV